MLRVGFNAYLLRSPDLRGWNRYAINLLAALPAQGVQLVLYARAPIHPDHLSRLPTDTFEVRIAPPMRYLVWEQRWLPRQLRADAIAVFHSPFNYGLPWFTPCPRVLTLHDAIDQIYYEARLSWRSRWRLAALRNRFAHWSSRRRAHHVITVSEHARGDLIRFLGLLPEKVTVVAEAADPHFLASLPPPLVEAVRARWNLARPYLFYVGGWEKRKNVPFLVRAFAAAALNGIDLVLAGGKDEQRAPFAELAAELGIGERLRLLGFVPDDDLPALYAGALAFAYPSEYEGFGLQVVEAMAVGCPVLAARATSLPEVLGYGGETFTLEDGGEELAGLLKRVVFDPDFRDDLSARTRRRAIDFSWDKAAAETVAVYRSFFGSEGQ